MNIVASILNWINDNKAMRDRELRAFVQSEYKNDWEYAYNTLRETRHLPSPETTFHIK